MATPSVRFTLPAASLFKIPPASLPTTVPPPTADFTYATKYEIPPKLYNNLLSVAYPITIAAVYAAAVTYFNQLNKQRGNKPWAFSKTRAFYWAVVAHNVLLAAYSAWTFKGMLQALRHSWPGLLGDHGIAGAVDAMCKMQGPRGLGNGVYFNSTTNIWTVPSHLVNLTPKGTPDVTDLGRLWNEGLAYYGWLFYISKFYEVLDTAVILAKGKTSSPLQTYHHAGAMLSMWAGIRYMSPPIWMFVLVNSGIHTLMYTYYALTSLAIPVPQSMKQLLTSMQITQIVVGGTYALAHLFVSYSVPVSIPRKVIPSVASAVSAASSVASSAVTSIATAASSAGIGNIIRKVALRAAGEEGLAENVPLESHPKILKNPLKGKTLEQIEWHTENEMIPCIDTSGQAFAILLNCVYFLPLIYLFVNFFIRSYTGRTSSKTKHPTHSSLIGKVSRDATKGVQRETQEEPLPLPEQTQSVANAARHAAEKFVNELENEAVGDRDGETETPEPAQNGGLGTIQGEKPSKPADEEANAEKKKLKDNERDEEEAREAEKAEVERTEEAKKQEELRKAEEAKKDQAEKDRLAKEQEEAKKAEQAKKEQAEKDKLAREQEEARKAQQAKEEQAEKERLAKEREEARKAEQAKKEQEERDRLAKEQEEAKRAEQAKKEQAEKDKLAKEQEEAKKAEEAKQKADKEAAEKAEAAKKQEEQKQAEEAEKAEKAKVAEQVAKDEEDKQRKADDEAQSKDQGGADVDDKDVADENDNQKDASDDEDDDIVNIEPVAGDGPAEFSPAMNGKSKEPASDTNDDSTADSSGADNDTETNPTTDDDAPKEDENDENDLPESPLIVDSGPNMSAVLVSGDIEKL